MIVAAEPRSVKPRCHNRPPYQQERMHFGINTETGFISGTVTHGDWASQGCKTWQGTGIGQPTEQFPRGTPYPIAHGFDCRGCVHLPEEFRDVA